MTDDAVDRARLKRASINGAAVNFGAQMVKFGLTFLNQILLARLLAPSDFGVVAMVQPVIAFVQLFADLGLSQATIQRKEIDQAQLSFLFWLNVAASTLLAVIVIATAPLVGAFYHEPRVAGATAALGAMFLINGLSTQHLALFARNMQFNRLALIDLSAFIGSVLAGLIGAWEGLGYWALVAGQMAYYVVNFALAWTLSPWRPSLPRKPDDARGMLHFGGNLTGFNLVNYFARNLDNVLIGRVDGGASLGLYDRAYKLLLLPINQINQPFARVAMPLLARTQGEPAVYRKAYLRMVEIAMLLMYPGVIFAIVAHDHLIRIVLGERWAAVAPIFGVLGVGALFAPLSQSTGWLFISQGRTREMRNCGIVSSAAFIASFVVGLHWGPLGVATCYIAVGCIQGPLLWWAATTSGPVRLRDILGVVLPYGAASVVCAGAAFGVDQLLPKGFASLLAGIVVAYAVFLAVLLCLPQGRRILHELHRHAHTTLAPFVGRMRARLDRKTTIPGDGNP